MCDLYRPSIVIVVPQGRLTRVLGASSWGQPTACYLLSVPLEPAALKYLRVSGHASGVNARWWPLLKPRNPESRHIRYGLTWGWPHPDVMYRNNYGRHSLFLNHKNYNFLECYWSKTPIALIHLPSCYLVVCHRTVQWANHIQTRDKQITVTLRGRLSFLSLV